MLWFDVDFEDEDGVVLQVGKYYCIDWCDIDIVVVYLLYIVNFIDFNVLVVQLDVWVCYVCDLQVLVDVDLVIFLGSKNIFGDLCWLCESGMVYVVEQVWQCKVLLLGICGGYQMLGEIIIDEVEFGFGVQFGLGVLKIVIYFVQYKIIIQVQVILGFVFLDWLVDVVGLCVSGYEIYMGEMCCEVGCLLLLQLYKVGQVVDDGVISDDGLVFGIYFYGLFDSDVFIWVLFNGLCQSKGLVLLDSVLEYVCYKIWQFDWLVKVMCEYIVIDKIYVIMC